MRQKKIEEIELKGKIINIFNMTRKEGWLIVNVYSATKFGVLMLTQSIANKRVISEFR